MFKLLSTLLFSYLLLFQITCIAEETQDVHQEQTNDAPETNTEQTPEVIEENSASEAQREADEAEAAELREAGVGEEPITE